MIDLLADITEDDLPNEIMKYVAEACGIEVARALLKRCPGMRIDVPARPNRNAMKRYIEVNYTGRNAAVLASKLGVSERFIYMVLTEKSAMRKSDKAPKPEGER